MVDDDWDNEQTPSAPDASASASELWILVDASGSMTEGGKCYMVRNVVRTVEQFTRFGSLAGSIRLVAFRNGEGWLVNWNVDNEFPLDMVFVDHPPSPTDLRSLLESVTGRFLLVSDGFFDRKSAQAINIWKTNLPKNKLFFVPVGGDAVVGKHRDIMVKPENLWFAVDAWRALP